MLQKAFAENAMINENTRTGVINLLIHRHENQSGNKKKYGLFADIYLCRNVSIEKKFKCLIWKTQLFNFSSAQDHPKILLPLPKLPHDATPSLPSSIVNDKMLLLSITQTENKWYGWWWWWSNYFQANIWTRPKRV